jgi:hypothetical protein
VKTTPPPFPPKPDPIEPGSGTAPTPEQWAEVVKDADELSFALRRMARIDSDDDPDFPRLAAALDVVAEAVEHWRKVAVCDDGKPLEPGDTSMSDMCALLLTSMWSGGRRAFRTAMKKVTEMNGSNEGG